MILENTGIEYAHSDEIQITKRLNIVNKLLEGRGENLSSFLSKFSISTELTQEVINIFTNNETAFFRDRRPFDFVVWLYEESIIPNSNLNILSLPCSTGQEPYSLMFSLLKNGVDLKHINIDAFDLDTNVVSRARAGKYNKFEMMRGVSEEDKTNFFEFENGFHIVKKNLREKINFKQHNLIISNLESQKYDLIFLRNVLFYFQDDVKKTVLENVVKSLKTKGVILLGNGEDVMIDGLKKESFEGMIYYSKL